MMITVVFHNMRPDPEENDDVVINDLDPLAEPSIEEVLGE